MSERDKCPRPPRHDEIRTYPAMNTEIVRLLELVGSQAELYAAARIAELEAENLRLGRLTALLADKFPGVWDTLSELVDEAQSGAHANREDSRTDEQ